MIKHYYETIGPENWFSYAKFYKDVIKNIPDGSNVVEIGCYRGRSTSCLGVEIKNSGKKIDLYCVDAWKFVNDTEQPLSTQKEFDEIYWNFLDNVRPIADIITVVKEYSVPASYLFDPDFFDFIFIDARHYYEAVKEDNKYWFPKLKEGGIIAGHDYFTSCHPGVKKAIDEFYGDKVNLIKDQNVWWVKK